jgi:hypothetical protein
MPSATARTTRRDLLRHSKRLAYVAPVVITAMKVQPAFAASDGWGKHSSGWSPPSSPKKPKGPK